MKSYLSGKHIVVTGAAGFLGSHLVDALLAQGANVTGVDNFITGRKQNLDHLLGDSNSGKLFSFIEADVSQPAANYLEQITQIDAILHFASPASPPKYQAAPVETYLVNSMGTHYLLDFLRTNHPQARFLFASTSEVYGDPEQHPQQESYWGNVNPNGVRSCYDEAKRLGETICGVFHRDFGMDVRIVRIFNTYGPRINPGDGRVIPAFIQHALEGKAMPIHGDGSQTRSFCYVDDLVAGIIAHLSGDTNGETINLGNPNEMTIAEVAEKVGQVVSKMQGAVQVNPDYHPLPGDDPTQRKPDISKASQLLDWHPSVSFEDGLKQTVAYFVENET